MICTEDKTSVTTAMLFIQALVENGRDFAVTSTSEKLASGEARRIFRISYPLPTYGPRGNPPSPQVA